MNIIDSVEWLGWFLRKSSSPKWLYGFICWKLRKPANSLTLAIIVVVALFTFGDTIARAVNANASKVMITGNAVMPKFDKVAKPPCILHGTWRGKVYYETIEVDCTHGIEITNTVNTYKGQAINYHLEYGKIPHDNHRFVIIEKYNVREAGTQKLSYRERQYLVCHYGHDVKIFCNQWNYDVNLNEV
jgi:hypothetical protein